MSNSDRAVAHRSKRNAALVCAAGTLRAFAVSLVGVLIAIYLAHGGFTAVAIGVVIGCGIAGNAVATVCTGLWADRWGRRRTLLVLGALTGAGYVAVAQ